MPIEMTERVFLGEPRGAIAHTLASVKQGYFPLEEAHLPSVSGILRLRKSALWSSPEKNAGINYRSLSLRGLVLQKPMQGALAHY